MATSTLGTLAVYLTANTSQFSKKMISANKLMSLVSTGIKVGAATGIAALGTMAVKGVQAFSESEEAINNLESALSAGGDNIEKYSKKFQDFASEMESKTIFDDEAIINTMTFGRNLGITANRMEEATTAAAGLAAKYNLDLTTAMHLIGKAYNGNTGALGRYGIVLDDNMSKEEKFNALLKIGANNFSQAEAKTKTVTGSLTQLGNAWGNMLEEIGKVVVAGTDFTDWVQFATQKTKELTEWIKTSGYEWVYTFKEAVIYIRSGIETIGAVLKPLGTLLLGFGKFALDLFFTIGKNIRIVFLWISENWSKVLSNMGKLAISYVKDIATAFQRLGENMWNTISFRKTDWAGVVMGLADNFKKTMKDVGIDEIGIELPDFKGLGNDLKDSLDQLLNIPAAIADIGQSTENSLQKLFDNEQAKAGAIAKSAKPEDTAADKAITGVPQMKFAGAVEKGTVEAYRAELAGKNTADEYNKKTADNTSRLVQEAKKQTRSLKSLDAIEVY